MTGRTAHALVDVNTVIEVDKIGEAVDFNPWDGLIGAETLADGLEVARIVEEYRMAVHAGLCGRNAGDRGGFHARVTIAAIDSVVANVMLVAELYGLFARNILIGKVRRASDSENGGECKSSQKNGGEHTETRDEICAAVENLRHVRVAP